MKTVLLAICLSVLWSLQARAEVTVKDYQAIMGGKNDIAIESMKGHIFGMGSGIVAAESEAFLNHGVRLYCAPAQLGINGDNYIDILNNTIKSFAGMPGLDATPISLLLMRGLVNTFPCPAK